MDLVAQIVKYNSQTSGRDKLCRFAQYSSKFSWWCVQEFKTSEGDLLQRLKNLENALSATRKVLRFGKSFDMIQGAVRCSQLQDFVHMACLTVSKTSQAFYLLVDHFIWFGKIGVIKTNTKKWSRVAARFWLVTIMLNLVRNIYDILTLWKSLDAMETKKKLDLESTGNNASLQRAVVMDTIKNSSDLFLPLTVLGYIQTSPGTQGLLGMISSLVGMMVVWNPKLKLKPS